MPWGKASAEPFWLGRGVVAGTRPLPHSSLPSCRSWTAAAPRRLLALLRLLALRGTRLPGLPPALPLLAWARPAPLLPEALFLEDLVFWDLYTLQDAVWSGFKYSQKDTQPAERFVVAPWFLMSKKFAAATRHRRVSKTQWTRNPGRRQFFGMCKNSAEKMKNWSEQPRQTPQQVVTKTLQQSLPKRNGSVNKFSECAKNSPENPKNSVKSEKLDRATCTLLAERLVNLPEDSSGHTA